MAKVQGTFYTAERLRRGTSPVSPPYAGDEGQPYPVNPPGSGVQTYLTLADTKDGNYLGKNGFVPVVTNEDGLTLMPVQNSEKDGLINPGVVQWTGIGYDFNVSSALARFQSVVLNSNAAVLSLTTPDATNDRIDLFILQILFDGDGIPNGMEADFITGTPAGSPVKPQIDPATQIELTQVTVTAASSTPTLTEEVIYDENIEWTGSSSGTGTVVFNSAANPFQGSLSIEATNIQNGLKIRLTDGSDYDLSGVQTLGMQLDLKAQMFAGQNIGVTFLDSTGAAISTELTLNFDKISTDYQFIGIAISQFSFTSFLARSIEFRYIRTKGATVHAGFFLDIIKLEGGINLPVTTGSFLGLSDTPSSYIGQASKVVSVKADETGLEFTTASGGGVQSVTGDGVDNTDPDNPVIDLADIATSGSPYDLAQEGASDGQVVTWVAANSRYEPVTFSGSSNWTVVGSDIYRDSNVAIGRTTIPSNGTGLYTFAVQSKVTGLSGDTEFFVLEGSSGDPHVIVHDAGLVQINPTGVNGEYLTFGNIVGFSGARGLVIRPTAAGNSIITTDQAGTLARFAIADTGALFLNGQAQIGVTIGTTINTWGTGVRGSSSGFAARKSFLVQNAAGTEHFSVATNGQIGFSEGGNLSFGTTTGTKIGLANNQKLAFWNKTPIIQPTNAITGATLVGGGGTTITDTDTFGGYTLQQIAAALINTGLMA